MKRINRRDEIVKLLSAARCCAKAIIDAAVVKFQFRAVKFVENLLFDEAGNKVSITRSHFSAHRDSINLFVRVTRELKAVQCENEFREANICFDARLFVRIHSDEGLTLETSVFESFTVANLPYRPCG